MAGRPDENAAQVHIQLLKPLFLQVVSKQADVGLNLFTLLLLQLMLAYAVIAAVIAAADARGYLCRPNHVRHKLTNIRKQLKDQSFYDSPHDNTPVQKGC